MDKFVRRSYGILKPYAPILIVVFICVVSYQIASMLIPYALGIIVDKVYAGSSEGYVMGVVAFVAALFLISRLIQLFRDRFENTTFHFGVQKHVSLIFLKAILKWSLGQHHDRNSADKLNVMTKGEQALVQLATMVTYNVIPWTLRVALSIGALAWLRWELGLVALLGVGTYALVTMRINRRYEHGMKALNDMGDNDHMTLSEIIRNIEIVILYSQQKRMYEEFRKNASLTEKYGRQIWNDYIISTFFRDSVIVVARAVLLALAVHYVYSRHFSAAYIVIITGWTSNAFDNLELLGYLHKRFLEQRSAVRKFFSVLDIRPDVAEASHPLRPASFEGRIEMSDVSFAYSSRKKGRVLKNITLSIEPRQRVAIVGRSGSGKTTLAYLIARAYDPTKGSVRIDGNDLRVLDLEWYRRKVAVVPQDVKLFDSTIHYNVTFGLDGPRDDIPLEQVERACELAYIHNAIRAMDDGYNTNVGERGSRLSGGERQRIGIARALMRDPGILILDEATSSLDAVNRELVQKSIDSASKGRTTIIIAHQLATIYNADKIFVLEKGRIVGQGKHEELMEACEAYRKLIEHSVFLP
jgi:ABC-type multidrug transport system fused ATPase/permease subunit